MNKLSPAEILTDRKNAQTLMAEKILNISKRVKNLAGDGRIELGETIVSASIEIENPQRPDAKDIILTLTNKNNPAITFTIRSHHRSGSGSFQIQDPYGQDTGPLGESINSEADLAEQNLITTMQLKLLELETALDDRSPSDIHAIVDDQKRRTARLLEELNIVD